MRAIEWQRESRVPRLVAMLLDGLRVDGPRVEWPDASEQEWERALYFLNRNQLTLIVRQMCGENLPPNLQPLDEFYRANCTRLAGLRAATWEVLSELERNGVETILLKGFARAGEYVPDPETRMHYDLDLYCPDTTQQAKAILAGLGYVPIAGAESDAASHIAPLARPTSWKWRGDFFDPETPMHVELHHLFWVPQVERFAFSGLEQFWNRRERIPFDHERTVCTLSRHDTLAYRCLHLLRHLLRGDIRAAGVYEIAWFLHDHRKCVEFWRTWEDLYPADLRQGQAVCFALAQRWFGCEMHASPVTAVQKLPVSVRAWMESSAASPVESFFSPAKPELALHFALLDSNAAKLSVALRRLVPFRHTAQMWEDPRAYTARLGSRLIYHARALAPTLSRLLIRRR